MSKSAAEWKELGNQAFSAKDFAKAIERYSEAIKIDASNHVFFSNRSASYAGIGKWEKSAEDAKETIRLDPTFLKGYYRLATAQIELKEFDAAAATIRQGLGVEANNPQLLKQQRMVQQLKKSAEAAEKRKQTMPVQYMQMNRELETIKVDRARVDRELKLAEFTKTDLGELPETSACYRSVGKMFLRQSREEIVTHLDKNTEEASKMETTLKQKAEYLEKKMKSQRQNIEELVTSSE
eukprot:scaffold38992_cov176-Amphora_coffeaeformis.AAC.2